MSLALVTDYSRYQREVSRASHRQMKAAGVEAVVVGLWHGISNNPYAMNSLANAKAEGHKRGGYTVVNNRPGRDVVKASKQAAGAHWNELFGVAIDVEIRGVTEAILADAIDEVRVLGRRPFLYTGNWFWNWWALELGHFPRGAEGIGAWIAVYNGIKTLESAGTRPGYGPIVGHQYTGSTPAFGTTVDFNVFDRDWLLAREAPPEPEPPAPPPPVEEDDLMGKIADQFAQLGREVEAEIAQAKKLPAPIPGPPGKTGPPGKDATGGATQRTYTVKAGDSLSGIADKFPGVSWRQIYDANRAVIGSDPNRIQPGMVLVIP